MSREATKKDHPRRPSEFQCPLCGRLFASDTACEAHKFYAGTKVGPKDNRRRINKTHCVEPDSVGLVAVDIDGILCWGSQEWADILEVRRDRLRQMRKRKKKQES